MLTDKYDGLITDGDLRLGDSREISGVGDAIELLTASARHLAVYGPQAAFMFVHDAREHLNVRLAAILRGEE